MLNAKTINIQINNFFAEYEFFKAIAMERKLSPEESITLFAIYKGD